jgi:hypothetical protein
MHEQDRTDAAQAERHAEAYGPTLAILNDLLEEECGGHEDVLSSYLTSLDNRALIRVVMQLQDLVCWRSTNKLVEERLGLGLNARPILGEALTVALERFAPLDSRTEALAEHYEVMFGRESNLSAWIDQAS